MAISQQGRLLKLTTPLAADKLLLKRFRCGEGLSQLYRIELDLLHEETAAGFAPTLVPPADVIGQPMAIEVTQTDGTSRFFHGICSRFSQGNRNSRFTSYRAELVPSVWLLTQRAQSRIFQQMTVPDILEKVLKGFNPRISLQGTFEKRNYCVQYRETDWDFASRLMEEEGIFYYFEHQASSHTIILGNDSQHHRPCPSRATLPFTTNISSLEEWEGGVLTWEVDSRLRTGKFSLRDHTFELPTNTLEASQTSRFNIGGNQNLEIYDFPGEYAGRFDGISPDGGEQPAELQKIFTDRQRTVKIRQEEIDVVYKTSNGTASSCALIAGYRFGLKEHPTPENNIQQLIVTAIHEAVQSPSYQSDEPVHNSYLVTFACIPHGEGKAPFRPLRKTPKPIVHGSQTAFVVGPPGEEIFVDKYGRVKVQFHWDRQGKKNAASSCWIRVGTSWAGKQWGGIHIPRIGQEVIVDFLEGDPDQPIITGSVYNAESMPPYKLPDNKTMSTLKSLTTPGGGGFNEIRFEDKAGKEQVFIHAQRNEDIRVKADCFEFIGNERHLEVEKDQLEKVGGDKHQQVSGNQNEKVGGSSSLTVGGSMQQKASLKIAQEAGTEVHVKGGMKVVVEAGLQLTLKGPGGFIDIGPTGVTIQGVMVLINSGGAAGAGSGCSPTSPKEAKKADTADPGQVNKSKAASSPPPPPPPPQFRALQQLAAQPPAIAEQIPSIPEVLRQAVPTPAAIVPPVPPPPALPPEAAAIVEQLEQAAAAYVEPMLPAALAAVQEAVQQIQNSPEAAALQQAAADARSEAQAAIAEARAAADEARQTMDEAKAAAAEAQAKVEEAKAEAEEAKQVAAAYVDYVENTGEQAAAMIQGAKDGLPF
jgi:type VI secretion system secreted protein VgrG